LEASGAQTTPRNAHINVKYEDHGVPNIELSIVASIATKPRSQQRDEMRLYRACLQTCSSQLEIHKCDRGTVFHKYSTIFHKYSTTTQPTFGTARLFPSNG